MQPERLLELSRGATERASRFWCHNHDRVNTIYRELAGSGVQPEIHGAAADLVSARRLESAEAQTV